MDDKTWLGAVAEARVCAELVAQRWDVFTSLTGKAPFDLVAFKKGQIVRVEVKGCRTMKRSGGYEVQLRSVRPNRTTNRIRHVSATACDVIAVYLEPINTVCFLFIRGVRWEVHGDIAGDAGRRAQQAVRTCQ